jgi:hypothetical protein
MRQAISKWSNIYKRIYSNPFPESNREEKNGLIYGSMCANSKRDQRNGHIGGFNVTKQQTKSEKRSHWRVQCDQIVNEIKETVTLEGFKGIQSTQTANEIRRLRFVFRL